MNPEFRRNLLLEMTPQRLVAMPLLLLLMYGAVSFFENLSLSSAAGLVVFLLLVIWGSRLAADAVLGEVAARTWDSQRMSALSPWSMSWGKLLGSTSFVWYGAALSAPAFLLEGHTDPLELLWLFVAGLLAQALSLFVSLVIQRLRPERLRFHVSWAQLVGLVGGISVWDRLPNGHTGTIEWFGFAADSTAFIMLSGMAFVAWCCFGIYRLMRVELQFRCWPVGWAGFTLFCAAYAAGFVPSWEYRVGPTIDMSAAGWLLRLLSALLVVIGLTWAAAIAEPKGFVRMRHWRDRLRQLSLPDILRATPSWAPGLAAALALSLSVMILAPLATKPSHAAVNELLVSAKYSLLAFAPTLFLFLLRDVGIMYFLTMDGRSRRVFFTLLVNFAVLYGLLPIILRALGLDAAVPLLVPSPVGHPAVVLAPLIEVILVGMLIWWRWHRLSRAMEAAQP